MTTIILYAIILILFITYKVLSGRKANKKRILVSKTDEKTTTDEKIAETETKHSLKDKILFQPAEFYTPKISCMSPNESRMFFYINKALDELIQNPLERQSYYVFPQICLYSLISINPTLSSDAQAIARYNYIAKSIDFAICKCNKQQYVPYGHSETFRYFAYTPVILIELDGKSHFSSTPYGIEAYKRQQTNDHFKNQLFKDLHIAFIRYVLSSNQIYAKDAIGIKEKIQECLTSC